MPLRYALAVNPPAQVPAALNGFALWNAILLVLMLVAYGYPIGQFLLVLKPHSAPVYDVTRESVSVESPVWRGTRDRSVSPIPGRGSAWGTLAVIVGISLVLGFIVLSRYQQNGQPLGAWAAICRGLGLTPDVGPASAPQPPLRTATLVAWTERHARSDCCRQRRAWRLRRAKLHRLPWRGRGEHIGPHSDPRRHGSRGDLQAARRLSLRQASLGRHERHREGVIGKTRLMSRAISRSVRAGCRRWRTACSGSRAVAAAEQSCDPPGIRGDPARGIAPCSACHGPGGYKLGAPRWPQHATYIESQLLAFAQGMRQNDISEQMRTIARQLTPEEMHAVAVFYGAPESSRVANK